jgi:hypothetical protein
VGKVINPNSDKQSLRIENIEFFVAQVSLKLCPHGFDGVILTAVRMILQGLM